jgi:hypothetical protein
MVAVQCSYTIFDEDDYWREPILTRTLAMMGTSALPAIIRFGGCSADSILSDSPYADWRNADWRPPPADAAIAMDDSATKYLAGWVRERVRPATGSSESSAPLFAVSDAVGLYCALVRCGSPAADSDGMIESLFYAVVNDPNAAFPEYCTSIAAIGTLPESRGKARQLLELLTKLPSSEYIRAEAASALARLLAMTGPAPAQRSEAPTEYASGPADTSEAASRPVSTPSDQDFNAQLEDLLHSEGGIDVHAFREAVGAKSSSSLLVRALHFQHRQLEEIIRVAATSDPTCTEVVKHVEHWAGQDSLSPRDAGATEDLKIVKAAIEALGHLRRERSAPILICAMERKYPRYDRDLRMKALIALDRIGGDQAIAHLIYSLDDDDMTVAVAAADVLAKRGEKRALPALRQMAKSPIPLLAKTGKEAAAKIEQLARGG